MRYTPKVKPWAHQRAALDKLRGKEAFALLMAMRTGKTKVTLDDFGRLEAAGKVKNLLVIAPAGVYKTWVTAAKDHWPEQLLGRAEIYVWESGKSGVAVRATREMEAFIKNQNGPRLLLLNIEALSKVEKAKRICLQFLNSASSMVVIDESTIIKNPQAKRTKFVNGKIRSAAAYRRILTGLIAPRDPLDLYSQFWFLNPDILGFNSFHAFRARYAKMRQVEFGGRSFKLVYGYRDLDELQATIRPHSFRQALEDCYDLPPKMYLLREVSLTQEQVKMYADLKKYATAQINEMAHVTATVVIAQILKLHQILCGHVKDEQGHIHDVPEKRTASLIELLNEYDGKAIIWCSYDRSIQKVTEALRKEFNYEVEQEDGSIETIDAVARFWGGNKKTREEEEKRFLNDPNCRFMVATPAAGGRGRTWLVANLVVYYSSTNDLEHRSQSEERAQAVDKQDQVAYVDMIVPNTVEMKILEGLKNKIDMSRQITGDNWREWLI